MAQEKVPLVHRRGRFGGWGRAGDDGERAGAGVAGEQERDGTARGDMPPPARGCLRRAGLVRVAQAGVAGAALARDGKGWQTGT